MHYFPGITWKDAMWGISYKNQIMLMATIPDHDLTEIKEGETLEDFKEFLK
jgi:hypothetical protein